MTTTMIHPQAVVDSGATLGKDVQIGPFAVIGPHVVLGDGCRVFSHAVINGQTTFGDACTIYPGAAIGMATQDMKFKGEKTYIRIGSDTTIREYVTINGATGEGTETHVGSKCLLMAYSHVAHNCWVGDGVIIANSGTLAGHVVVQDNAIIGGLSAVHQFCRIGRMAIVGGCSKVVKDILPYLMVDGHPAVSYGLNTVGMTRRKYPKETIRVLKRSYKILYRSGLGMTKAAARLQEELPSLPELEHICEFIRTSQRGITKAKKISS